jgi:para-aminobenzoate synthetase component 1
MGRYSYLTANPFVIVKSTDQNVSIINNNNEEKIVGNPWDVLDNLISEYSYKTINSSFPFEGGAIGYWTYDLGRMLEDLPDITNKQYQYPEMSVGFYDWVLVQDHTTNLITLVTSDHHPHMSSQDRIEWVFEILNNKSKNVSNSEDLTASIESNFSVDEYTDSIENVKKYLEEGDIYQANISQRFSGPFEGDSWELYLKLRTSNPGAFSAYISNPDIVILSSSPELFISLNDKNIQTRPIKGTTPRGNDLKEDNKFANQLTKSIKDQAENVMIVDLMRNDLGKVSSIGSVKVSKLFELEKHPTVWHLVSTIDATLSPRYGPVDLLRQCFPGGSITGAPKIRAMEIIEEIEPDRRGVYCGSIGYIGFNGNMSTNIAIRTMTLEDNIIVFHSGGGIVSDSDPMSEYDETIDKAKGLMTALDIEL